MDEPSLEEQIRFATASLATQAVLKTTPCSFFSSSHFLDLSQLKRKRLVMESKAILRLTEKAFYWRLARQMSSVLKSERSAAVQGECERGRAVAAIGIVSLSFPSAPGQQDDVHQGNAIISGSGCLLLATPCRPVQPGREGCKMRHLPIE